MQYQLVLQFAGDSSDDYDAMLALEDELIVELGDAADVDGHDIGSGERNIFIITSEPEITFQHARAVLGRFQLLDAVKAAYRPTSGEAYIVLWPHNCQTFSVA